MTLRLRHMRNMRTSGTYILVRERFRYEQIGLFYNPPAFSSSAYPRLSIRDSK
jgi:hypothetical protein